MVYGSLLGFGLEAKNLCCNQWLYHLDSTEDGEYVFAISMKRIFGVWVSCKNRYNLVSQKKTPMQKQRGFCIRVT